MNPQHHYDKPGKAPDGMDLVAMYADQATPPASQQPRPQRPSGERKILYWYDAMHPQYKLRQAGQSPGFGMDLVPKYAEEQTASMAPGSVMISSEKQQLIGVRTAEVKREIWCATCSTTGQITADETKIAHVHVKVNGFIDKVYRRLHRPAGQEGPAAVYAVQPRPGRHARGIPDRQARRENAGQFGICRGGARLAVAAALHARAPEAVGHQRRADQEAR